MTVAQVFIAITDFLLFIVLGIVFIRQAMIFRIMKQTQELLKESTRATDQLNYRMTTKNGDGLWPMNRSWDQQDDSLKGS